MQSEKEPDPQDDGTPSPVPEPERKEPGKPVPIEEPGISGRTGFGRG